MYFTLGSFVMLSNTSVWRMVIIGKQLAHKIYVRLGGDVSASKGFWFTKSLEAPVKQYGKVDSQHSRNWQLRHDNPASDSVLKEQNVSWV